MSVDKLDELIFEREWRRCFPDWEKSTLDEKVEAFDYFARNYWHIRHPEKGRIKFEMREAQLETIKVWIGDRYSIALKARQIGFSTLAGALCFWLAFGWRDRQITMISKTERDAIKLLAKSKYGYRFLPDWMKIHPDAPVVDSNLTKMSMTNESFVESLPSNEPARGESAFLIVVDEMGQLPNSDEAWAAIEPAVDVGGRVIMLGTANGEGNLFHKLWVAAKSPWGNGTNRFTGIFHSWRAGGRDDAWYAAKKADLPEWQLAQEYPDNPDEAFLKSGRPVFNLEKLRAMETFPPEMQGHLRQLPNRPIEFVEDGGPLAVYFEPNPKHRYVMGVDVAEGLEHGDYSSVHVIDVNTHEVVAHWHGHIDPDLLGAEVVPLLGKWYCKALAVVESNNHGLTTLTALQRVRYYPLYRRRRITNRQKTPTEQLGWATTKQSKALAIDELGKELRDGGLMLYDQATIAELRTYVREGDGKMHGSPHDDRVMSLAIANQGRQYVYLQEYKVETKPERNSLKWFEQHGLFDFEDEESPSFIGSFAAR